MEKGNNRAGWTQMQYEPKAAAPLAKAPVPVIDVMPAPVVPMPDAGERDDMVLVMAYVKKQKWGSTYEPEMGLTRGTLFPELDLPFVGEGACPEDE